MNTALWTLVVVVVVVGALVLVWATVLCAARVRRLDRLHVRTDAARAGLESALERRAGAALVVAAVLESAAVPESAAVLESAAVPERAVPETAGPDRAAPPVGRLRAAVAATRTARVHRGDREAAENVLGRALAGIDRSVLPSAVLEEIVDAEQLLILARRVHNDAVRDTLGLRSRRLVRWLHLAGTAPLPSYFEIADAEAGVMTAAPSQPRDRRVAPPR